MSGLASRIDQTLLAPAHSRADLFDFVVAAAGRGYASLCVPPASVAQAREILLAREPDLPVGTVAGFPAGFGPAAAKAEQARWAIGEGAAEIDYVVDQTAAAHGRLDVVAAEAEEMVAACRERGALVKAILECDAHEPGRVRDMAEALTSAGVDYLKTSTGVYGKAREEDVRLLREVAGRACAVKASGGIRTRADAVRMVEAGADRLGTSSGPAILA